MKKLHIFSTLIILGACLFVGTVNAQVKQETLKEACEAEEISCDVQDKEFDDELLNVYIFRGDGCGFFFFFLTYIGSIASEYEDKINFVVYEVGNNEDNWDLYEKVGAKFGDEISGYPYMVIGKYIFNGYASSDDAEIKEALDAYVAMESPYDVVKEIEAGNLEEVEKEIVGAKAKSSTGIVLAFIFGVVIVLVMFMGYTLSKKEPIKK